MRKYLILILFLTYCLSSFSQTTTVSATVQDSDGQLWMNGTYQLQFNPNPNQPNLEIYNINGVPLDKTQLYFTGSLDGSGVFTQSGVYDNTQILPTGSSWSLTICPKASVLCTTIPNITISGATMDLSTLINSTIKPPRFPAQQTASAYAYGYSDIEVFPIPSPGGTYFNVTSNALRIWTGSTWVSSLGGNGTINNGANYLFSQYPSPTSGTTLSPSFVGTDSSQRSLIAPLPRPDPRSIIVTLPPYNCLNVADPTGTTDSTCAIQAAITFACSQPTVANVVNTVYIPAGTYLISAAPGSYAALTDSCPIRITGDSKEASILKLTGTTQANLLTVGPFTSNPCSDYLCQWQMDNILLKGNGPNTTGVLLELYGATGWKLDEVNFYDHGGIGLNVVSERGHSFGSSFSRIRESVLLGINANENYFVDTHIIDPGETANNYNYNINAVGGVFPPPNAGVCSSYPNWTANTVYHQGDIICDTNGNEEIVQASGSVVNNRWVFGTSGSSAPAWPSTRSATTVDNGVTWRQIQHNTILQVDYHSAFTSIGVQNLVYIGGSTKASAYQACFGIYGGENATIANNYCEAFIPNAAVPSILINPNPSFQITSSITGTQLNIPTNDWQWAPAYVNNPALATGNTIAGVIYPPNYNPSSSTIDPACAGVQENQFENVSIFAWSGDGQAHLAARNQSGSTANITCAGARLKPLAMSGGNTFGTFSFIGNHLEGTVVADSTGYSVQAGDQRLGGVLKTVLIGPVPDGKTLYPPGTAGGVSTVNFVTNLAMQGNTARTDFNEQNGFGYAACIWRCNIQVNDAPQGTGTPTTSYTQQQGYAQGLQAELNWYAIYQTNANPNFTLTWPGVFQVATSTNYFSAPISIFENGIFKQYTQVNNSDCTVDITFTYRNCFNNPSDGGSVFEQAINTGTASAPAWSAGTAINPGTGINSITQNGVQLSYGGQWVLATTALNAAPWVQNTANAVTVTCGQTDHLGGNTACQIADTTGGLKFNGIISGVPSPTPPFGQWSGWLWAKGTVGGEKIAFGPRNDSFSASWCVVTLTTQFLPYFCSIVQSSGIGAGQMVITNATTSPETWIVDSPELNQGAYSVYIPNTSTTNSIAPQSAISAQQVLVNGVPVTGNSAVRGNANLVSGTVTITNSAACTVGSTCGYKFTNCGPSGTAIGVPSLGSVSPGTSFVINSISASNTVVTGDNSRICWQIN